VATGGDVLGEGDTACSAPFAGASSSARSETGHGLALTICASREELPVQPCSSAPAFVSGLQVSLELFRLALRLH